MNKKQNHISARQAAENAVIRDEQNRRIRYAATNPVPEFLKPGPVWQQQGDP